MSHDALEGWHPHRIEEAQFPYSHMSRLKRHVDRPNGGREGVGESVDSSRVLHHPQVVDHSELVVEVVYVTAVSCGETPRQELLGIVITQQVRNREEGGVWEGHSPVRKLSALFSDFLCVLVPLGRGVGSGSGGRHGHQPVDVFDVFTPVDDILDGSVGVKAEGLPVGPLVALVNQFDDEGLRGAPVVGNPLEEAVLDIGVVGEVAVLLIPPQIVSPVVGCVPPKPPQCCQQLAMVVLEVVCAVGHVGPYHSVQHRAIVLVAHGGVDGHVESVGPESL